MGSDRPGVEGSGSDRAEAQEDKASAGGESSISDSELKKYAEVNQTMQESSPEEQEAIKDVLKDKDLSIKKYKEISGQLQRDKELQKRYMDMVKGDSESKDTGPASEEEGGPVKEEPVTPE
ncbi:MAG: DUF4168 domain-containing protein [Chitinivibrionales bacterium]